MSVIQIIGGSFLILSAIVLIIVTLLQESKQSGLSAMSGGSSDSYLSKNRGRSMSNKLANITKVVAAIFFIATLALNIILTYVK